MNLTKQKRTRGQKKNENTHINETKTPTREQNEKTKTKNKKTYLVEVVHEDLGRDEGLVELGAQLELHGGGDEDLGKAVHLLGEVAHLPKEKKKRKKEKKRSEKKAHATRTAHTETERGTTYR